MSLVFPRLEVAARWQGAWQTRKRRAVIDAFLRAHGETVEHASDDIDYVSHTSSFVLRTALIAIPTASPLTITQHWAIGRCVCGVSRYVSGLLGNPAAWRVGALVSICHVLTPRSDWIYAATLASAIVRDREGSIYNGKTDLAPPFALPTIADGDAGIGANADGDAHGEPLSREWLAATSTWIHEFVAAACEWPVGEISEGVRRRG